MSVDTYMCESFVPQPSMSIDLLMMDDKCHSSVCQLSIEMSITCVIEMLVECHSRAN